MKQKFVSFSLRRLLCNALLQPHFDYACAAWYPDLNKRFVKKIQVCQNKCIRCCLKLKNRDHVGVKEFRELNLLPTKERFEQCVCANIFKFFNNMPPAYTSELYQPFNHGHNTRRSNCRLQLPHRNTSYGHKALSFFRRSCICFAFVLLLSSAFFLSSFIGCLVETSKTIFRFFFVSSH